MQMRGPPGPPGQFGPGPGQFRPEFMPGPNGQPPPKMMRPSSQDGGMMFGPGGQPGPYMNGMPPEHMSQQQYQHMMMMNQNQDPNSLQGPPMQQGPMPGKEKESKSSKSKLFSR